MSAAHDTRALPPLPMRVAAWPADPEAADAFVSALGAVGIPVAELHRLASGEILEQCVGAILRSAS